MQAFRQTIDSSVLNGAVSLPKDFQNKEVELILFLKEERNAMPQFSISEIDAMLKGSYTESLIGILPHSEASAEEYRTERLKIKEPFDYTEWQRQLYDGVPLKSFPRDAMELRTKETP